jgi:UDP-N-acetylmuramoyl-tripeptide--D-alanyl-D-alanine ligase
MNALGALAAASAWGIAAEDARRVFPSLKPADKRGEVVRYDAGFTVINDSYNSSPTALRELTNLLASTPGYSRRILAAGEMLELGPSSPELHTECGRYAGEKRAIDAVLGVQGSAADLVRAAIEAGHPRQQTKFFENSAEAARFVAGFVERGDLLLIKGSRGVRMEKILEALDAKYKRVAPNVATDAPRETAEVNGVNAERRR